MPRLVAAVGLAALLSAQDPDANTYGHSRHGAAFDEGPRQAAFPMPGLNPDVHLPVAGLDGAAQAFFDQGLVQLHGFWYLEAERSFRQVAMLRPDSAMAYVGMTLANVETPDRAAGFVAGAVERGAAVPRYEQLWIDAYARFYRCDDACRQELRSGDGARVAAAKAALAAKNTEAARKADAGALHRQLIRDLGTIVHEFPADIEAKALLAIEIWLAYDWGDGVPIVSHAAVDALLDAVFAKVPLHPAHHYRIHLWDREAPERALRSAALVGPSAPAIAHQWHKAGHIFDKLGRYDDAAWQQEASSRVDHAQMQRDHVMPFAIHNYGHNQEWLCRSLQHVGRVHEAVALATNMVGLPRHPDLNRVAQGDEIAGYGRRRLLQALATYELWDELRTVCENGLVEPTGAAEPDADRLLHLGLAAFRLGDAAAGERALAQLDGVLAQARAERAAKVDDAEERSLAAHDDAPKQEQAVERAFADATEPVRDVRACRATLRGIALLQRGDGAAALAAFATAGAVDPGLRAEAHVLAGEPGKALELLQRDQEEHDGRVPPLARLVLALHAAGEHERARAAFATLRRAGGRADLDVPLLRRLAPVAAAYGLPADWREPQPVAADVGERPDLDALGPFHWSPYAAPGFDLPVAGGGRRTLARGRPTLVVFYLGFGCLHCVAQLQALAPKAGEFAAAGIDVVAIGTDTAAAAAASLQALPAAERFPFPLLADPELAAFKAWRCHDDFESMPLHGVFLVDAAGAVRWQDVRFEPFTQLDWLLGESRRLLALPGSGAGSR